jgi:hypothetical protein
VRLVANCRLAFRTEGPEVVIYLAEPATMAGAIVLARLNKSALTVSNNLFEDIKAAYSKWLQVQIATCTGVIPDMRDVIPPEPPEGRA